ncbi:MAG TPA: N,N-dimethylformamidase beta subunit family domain-containing protein, partial [Zeimonas sp.]
MVAVIRGYPQRPSVIPGETLELCVATDAPAFRVAFHRWTGAFVPMLVSDWLPGEDVPERASDVDWRWPPYRFRIPDDWPTGVYVAHLQEQRTASAKLALSVSMDRAAALFVVRGPGRSAILYKLPIATWHAYNCTGGACFYHRPPRSI